MALTCPNCSTLNRCNCKSCNPNEDPKDLVIIDYDNECYQCYKCNHRFSEQDSLDFEWDMMHQNIKNSLTPKMCIQWKKLDGKERKKFEECTSYGAYGFESAFFQHFKIRHNECGSKELESLEIMIDRDQNINSVINPKT
jgi:hypothetical protein